MEKMTIKDLMEYENISITEIAKITGLSIPLISKIKNNQIAISSRTIKAFRNTFNVDIYNEPTTYNQAYDDLLAKYYILQHEYNKKVKKCQELELKLEKIKGVLKNAIKEI